MKVFYKGVTTCHPLTMLHHGVNNLDDGIAIQLLRIGMVEPYVENIELPVIDSTPTVVASEQPKNNHRRVK